MSEDIKQYRKPTKKIHRVILGDRDFFIYALTKQGAIRDVVEYLKQGALCRVATGEDMFNLGRNGGEVINLESASEPDSAQPDIFAEQEGAQADQDEAGPITGWEQPPQGI